MRSNGDVLIWTHVMNSRKPVDKVEVHNLQDRQLKGLLGFAKSILVYNDLCRDALTVH